MSLPNRTSRVPTGKSVENKEAREKSRLVATLLASLAIYIGSYLALSVQGSFEPAVIGLGGVKRFMWAPRGFVTHFRWNSTMRAAYMPLYLLDTRLWHTSDDAYSDRYPVNSVPASEIDKVYAAWSE